MRAPPHTPPCLPALQAGAFEGSPSQYLELNEAASRAGVEWVDIEADRFAASAELKTFAEQSTERGVRLIGSFHVFSHMPEVGEVREHFRACQLGGMASLAKFVGMATEPRHAQQVCAPRSTIVSLTSDEPRCNARAR